MHANELLALLLTIPVGVSLGMLGSGGTIVMLPVLVYVAGTSPHQSVSMSLAIVGGTSLVGAIIQHGRGNLHWAAAITFVATGVIGAYFGSFLTHLVSQRVLMLTFSALMMAVGWRMLRNQNKTVGPTAESKLNISRCLLVGGVVGVLTGFLGVGGGFLIVPALVLIVRLKAEMAIGTSLAIVAVNSAAGLAGHAWEVSIDWKLTSLFLGMALIGMAIGTWYSSQVPEQRLKRIFAWFVIAFAAVIASINGYGVLAS